MSAESMAAALEFTVNRRKPELVCPEKLTPHEYKALSDIDDQETLRFQITVIQVYAGHSNLMQSGKDPVEVIRGAVGQALVHYYPLAGRLREGPNRKLWVDCTGEGVPFVEADADVTLQQFYDTDSLQPPFNQLLYEDVPETSNKTQMWSFTLAVRLNHTIMDAFGLSQFLEAIGEFACGNREPSVLPVWKRYLLNSRYPPCVTREHREYDGDIIKPASVVDPAEDMVEQSFFLGPTQVSAIRNLLPLHLRQCTTFELLTAFIWRCRTAALRPDPEEEMRVCCIINLRRRSNSALPPTFYGNGFSFPAAVTTAGKLCQSPLEYAVKLVRKAKAEAMVDTEYIQSVADLMVLSGRRRYSTITGNFFVSDIRHKGLQEVDYGWGKAVYGGVATVMPKIASFLTTFKNQYGTQGILVPIWLSALAMNRFQNELGKAFEVKHNSSVMQ